MNHNFHQMPRSEIINVFIELHEKVEKLERENADLRKHLADKRRTDA